MISFFFLKSGISPITGILEVIVLISSLLCSLVSSIKSKYKIPKGISKPAIKAPAYTMLGFGEIGLIPESALSTTFIDGSVIAKLIAASSLFCNNNK